MAKPESRELETSVDGCVHVSNVGRVMTVIILEVRRKFDDVGPCIKLVSQATPIAEGDHVVASFPGLIHGSDTERKPKNKKKQGRPGNEANHVVMYCVFATP